MMTKSHVLPGFNVFFMFILIYCLTIDFSGNFYILGQSGSSIMLLFVSCFYLMLYLNLILFRLDARQLIYMATRIVSPFMPFLIWAGLSLFYHNFHRFRYQMFLCLVLFPLTIFLNLLYRKSQASQAKAIFVGLIGISVLLYIVSILFHGLGNSYIYGPRSMAMIACVGILQLNLTKSANNKLLRILLTLGVLLSLSRTAILLCSVLNTLHFLDFRLQHKSKSLNRLFLFLIAIPGSFNLISSIPSLYNRFSAVGDNGEIIGMKINTNGRSQVWSFLMSGVKEHLLFGSGIGGSQIAVSERFVSIVQPHNDYLRVAFDLGIIGIILWLFSIFACLRQLIRYGFLDLNGAIGALLVYLGFAFSDNPIVYPFFITSFGYSLSANAIRIKSEVETEH